MIADLTFEERSLLFAKLSAIAYSDDLKDVKKQVKLLGNFTTVAFYNKSGAQAYRFQNKQDIVIACRGTQPTQLNDIAADLKAAPVVAETISRVHRGFKEEVDELWPMISVDLESKASRNKNVWFTGHSLGAAMTTIMASRCEDDPDMPHIQEIYTYGSPRVGWPKFVKSLSCKHNRWVNNNDIVTTVPPRIMGYRHDGIERYMNAYGQVRNPTGWLRIKDKLHGLWMGIKNGQIDSFSDHSIDNYIANLENYVIETAK